MAHLFAVQSCRLDRYFAGRMPWASSAQAEEGLKADEEKPFLEQAGASYGGLGDRCRPSVMGIVYPCGRAPTRLYCSYSGVLIPSRYVSNAV